MKRKGLAPSDGFHHYSLRTRLQEFVIPNRFSGEESAVLLAGEKQVPRRSLRALRGCEHSE
jgi:hypothetical protein